MLKLNRNMKVVTLALLSVTISAGITQLYINKEQVKIKTDSKEITDQRLIDKKEINTNAVIMKVDGKEIGFLRSEEEVKAVLDYVRDYYVRQNNIKVLKGYKVKNNITYSITKTTINKIMNSKDMSENIIKNKNLIMFEISGISEEQKQISPGVVINWSEELLKGESRVKSEGKSGVKLITRETIFENDKLTSEKILSQKVIKPCEDKIIIKGSRNPKVIATTGLLFPSRGSITSPFGERWGKMHKGIDIAAPIGTPIYAADDGKINFSGTLNGYGKVIKINHDKGIESVYAHCSVLNGIEGQVVKKGQKIAEVGNTGKSTGPHVHFELIINGKAENPMEYLKK